MIYPSRSFLVATLILGTLFVSAGSNVLGQFQRYNPRQQYGSRTQQNSPGYQRYQTPPGYRPGFQQQNGNQLGNRYRIPQNGNAIPLPKPGVQQPGSDTPWGPSQIPVQPKSTNQPAISSVKASASNDASTKYSLYPRMIAEFEPQRAIVLSVCDLQPHHQHVLRQIVDKSAGHAEIVILYNNNQQLKETVGLLKDSPVDHVSFYQLQLDTVWLRDFGPRIVEVEDGTRTFDFFYYGVRPYDDAFPERWSLETDSRLNKISWTLQGGNLICNGQGLGIATTRIFEDNAVSIGSRSSAPSVNSQGKDFVKQELKKDINLSELIVLEPLHNESTKHVDMFAAFIAPDHVLVAELGPGVHRSNSQILEYNAKKLARVSIDGKPLRVNRIRIPQPQGNSWSTYTNAIFTDKLILLPIMNTDPPAIVRNAIATYRKHLPNHHIATVDITSMKNLQGSLHCLSINLPAAAPMPDGVIDFQAATRIADATVAKEKQDTTAVAKINGNYTIDEQLRRIFKSSTHDYLVDAYAIGLQGDIVTLLRFDNHKTIRVKTTGVCKTDQYWIGRNAKKIRENGATVQRIASSKRSR